MEKNFKLFILLVFCTAIFLVILIPALKHSGIIKLNAQVPPPGTIVIPVSPSPSDSKDNLQLHTFPFITPTPTAPVPTSLITSPTNSPTSPINQSPTFTPTGPPIPPGNHVKKYCVDDNPGLEIEPCDDASKCDIPHGAGGPNGPCGTVIGWEHAIIDAVGQGSGTNSSWDNLSKSVTSSCYTAQAINTYPSTYNVIDAYNLAGFRETSRTNHISGSSLLSFWQNAPGGYRYSPGTSMQGVGPGYVMFFTSGHVAIVNHVQVDSRGNGKMSFLHSGGGFYLGLGTIVNGTLNQTSAGENVIGFGGHNNAVPFSQEGTGVCTPGR